jgi:inosine-uridine nucleoside N-ribohydrolase
MLSGQAPAVPAGSIKVIFDTDFVVPPQDDGTALVLALHSPELKVLGVTTVAGNDTMQRGTSDALRVLEIANRTDVPLYRGSNRPLVHVKSEWATTVHGKWWSDEPPPPPPGGFAKKQAEKESAIDFMIRTVNANPGEITILAIGPLTNIAMAIRQDPDFGHNVKKIAIMGGAVASLPGGGGNVTPNAEFNIWVDPEAAWVVLHSGIPMVFTPLNVTSKTNFSKEAYDKIVSVDTPITRLIKERMAPAFEKNPTRRSSMYDQLTVASLIDPSLVKTVDVYMDVVITHGPAYGTTVGAMKQWEGGEQSVKVPIQVDVDNDRFIKMFVDRVSKP